MRNLATQVPDVVGRLLRAQVILPPVWHQPALSHPPIPLPPRRLSPSAFRAPPPPIDSTVAASASASFASSSSSGHPFTRPIKRKNNALKHLRGRKARVQEIVYDEDAVRRRFFQDFPFEALRPVSLVEGPLVEPEDGVQGEEWYALAQRGDYPTVEKWVSAWVASLDPL